MLLKRADVNWFIVTLAIMIIGLVVLLGVFTRFDFTRDIDREVCHQSVLLKATIPETQLGNFKDGVNLNCKTKRICVTSKVLGSGNCESELGQDYITERITSSDKERAIKQLLAREMAECWAMMGEGKLKIFNREATTKDYLTVGVVCSRVMFDDTITDEINTLSGFSEYLLSHKVPTKQISYWDYFRNTPDGDTLRILTGENIVMSESSSNSNSYDDSLDLRKTKAILFTENKASELGQRIGQITGGVASTIFFLTPVGRAGSAVIGKSNTGLAVVGASYIAGSYADDLFKKHFSALGEGVTTVSGLYVIDYSREGFNTLANEKNAFYLANIP